MDFVQLEESDLLVDLLVFEALVGSEEYVGSPLEPIVIEGAFAEIENPGGPGGGGNMPGMGRSGS